MKNILIVEDNMLLLGMIEESMKGNQSQFNVLCAENGEEALKILKDQEVSLLVTDIKMPKLDGLLLLAYMHENHPKVPCIVMTAFAESLNELNDQMESKTGQPVTASNLRFLRKPFQMEELSRVITESLARQPAGGRLTGISVVNFVQLIEMEQSSCLLEVVSTDNKRGYFYFKDGVPYDAVCDGSTGDEAALKIIALDKDVKIDFKEIPGKKIAKRIKMELMNLLMEAMRGKDESTAHPETEVEVNHASEEEVCLFDCLQMHSEA